MATKRIFISLPDHLLSELDAAAALESLNRSAYIREAINLRLSVDSYIESRASSNTSKVNLIRRAHVEIKMHRNYNKNKANIDWRE